MNPETIKRAVAAHFHLAVEDIRGRSRVQPVAWARQLAMYFTAQTNPCWSDRCVARHFGVNRSTVTYARQVVRGRIEVHPRDREAVLALTSHLTEAQRNGTGSL